MDEPFKLRNIYCTKKLSYYCNTKDKVPDYQCCCPACNSKYIGKTDQNFDTPCSKAQWFRQKVTGLQSFVRM